MLTIGIIGSGNLGIAIARLAIRAGFNVVLSNSRGPESLASLVDELGSHARAATPDEVARAGDLVVVSVPLLLHRYLPVESLKGKIVIDTMNYYPAISQIPELNTAKLTSSELVQQYLKSSKVVKAFHNQDFLHLLINARPNGTLNRTTLPIAGDDVEANKKVIMFINAIGYHAIDTGSLADSWRIEPGSPIYVWPYVPKVTDELSKEEQKKMYMTPGIPVSIEQAHNLVKKATRIFPVGGFLKDLPPIYISLISDFKNSPIYISLLSDFKKSASSMRVSSSGVKPDGFSRNDRDFSRRNYSTSLTRSYFFNPWNGPGLRGHSPRLSISPPQKMQCGFFGFTPKRLEKGMGAVTLLKSVARFIPK